MRQIWKHGCDNMKDERTKFIWIQTSGTGRVDVVKCKKPLAHNPQFEGKYHCKACAREELE